MFKVLFDCIQISYFWLIFILKKFNFSQIHASWDYLILLLLDSAITKNLERIFRLHSALHRLLKKFNWLLFNLTLGILNTSDSELWEWDCYTQCKLVKLFPQVLQKNLKILLRTNKRISSAGVLNTYMSNHWRTS